MERLKAETAKILGIDVGLDLNWVYRNILGMSDEDASALSENISEFWWADQVDAPSKDVQTRLAKSQSVEEALRNVADAYTTGRENLWGLANTSM